MFMFRNIFVQPPNFPLCKRGSEGDFWACQIPLAPGMTTTKKHGILQKVALEFPSLIEIMSRVPKVQIHL